MGRDRRIIDSREYEAQVDNTLKALQVKSWVASTYDIDDIITELQKLNNALASDATDQLLAKITDGTDILDIVGDGNTYAGLKGLIVFGTRYYGTDIVKPLPVCLYSDSVTAKGLYTIPIIPMTGGLEEGTFTRGLIVETEVSNIANTVSVANTTFTTVATLTAGAGKTYWITDIFAEPDTQSAGIEFRWRVTVNNVVKKQSRIAAGHGLAKSFHKPLKVAAGEAVDLDIEQFSGGAVNFNGAIWGFETVNSELD